MVLLPPAPPLAQLFQSTEITGYQRFFLSSTPPLQLSFALNRGCQRLKRFRIDELNWATSSCVLRGGAVVVSLFARCEVAGMTDIERIVTAAEHVNKRHGLPRASHSILGESSEPATSEPLDSGRVE